LLHGGTFPLYVLLQLCHLLHAHLLLHLYHLLLCTALSCQHLGRERCAQGRDLRLATWLKAKLLSHVRGHWHAGADHTGAHCHISLHLGIDAHQPLSLAGHSGLMLRVSGSGGGQGQGSVRERKSSDIPGRCLDTLQSAYCCRDRVGR